MKLYHVTGLTSGRTELWFEYYENMTIAGDLDVNGSYFDGYTVNGTKRSYRHSQL